MHRMYPAYQSLCSRHTIVVQAVLRLEVNSKLSFGQGRLHGIGYSLFLQQFAAKSIIIYSIVLVILSFDTVCSQQSSVTHLLYRNRTVRNFVDAPCYRYFLDIVGTIELGFADKFFDFIGTMTVFQQEHETVGTITA